VFGIDRPTIQTGIKAISQQFSLLLNSEMAGVAQRLKLTGKERIRITTPWDHVINDGAGRVNSTLLAEPTKRLDAALVTTEVSPALRVVEPEWWPAFCFEE